MIKTSRTILEKRTQHLLEELTTYLTIVGMYHSNGTGSNNVLYLVPLPTPLAACCSKSVAAYRAIIVINIIFMTIVLVTFGVVGASQAPLRILCQQTFHNAIQELEIFTFR